MERVIVIVWHDEHEHLGKVKTAAKKTRAMEEQEGHGWEDQKAAN
jgi:hypothetical protein